MKYELSDKYDFFNYDVNTIETKIKSVKYGVLIKKTVYAVFENGLIQTYYLDAEDKILFSYAPDKEKKEAVGEIEEINRNEIEYSGYGYHGGGRPRKGEDAKRKTVSISGTPAEIDQLKQLADAEDKTLSRYIIDNLLK